MPKRDPYTDPDVMVPWCRGVGLDPTRVLQSGFAIEHVGDTHVAVYTLAPPPEPGQLVNHDADQLLRDQRLVVDFLPRQCEAHPDVPHLVPIRVSVSADVPAVVDQRMCQAVARKSPGVAVRVSFDPGDQDGALAALELAVADERARIEATR